jgi:hypothetical protein
MTDQQLLISAVPAAGHFKAEYIEPDGPTSEETLSGLVAVLDNEGAGR